MSEQSQVRNPFMLKIEPEVVLAAIENSERLGQLNRHLCRPLDRPMLSSPAAAEVEVEVEVDGDDAVNDDSDSSH